MKIPQGFHIIDPPDLPPTPYWVRVSAAGNLTMSDKLFREFPERRLAIAISDDCREMLLGFDPDHPQQAIRFPEKRAQKRLEELSRRIARQGISLPAEYTVCWEESCEGWLGRYKEPRSAAVMAASVGRHLAAMTQARKAAELPTAKNAKGGKRGAA